MGEVDVEGVTSEVGVEGVMGEVGVERLWVKLVLRGYEVIC